ncbi:MAG: hypothetical protein NTV43_13305 [Methylococcales bacterium]|nr:hypothetical protein [Methylococcales bacterium]
MNTILKAIIACALLFITVLVFSYPQLMVAPGKLIAGHKHLEADCFACHAPFAGADSARCTNCHKPDDIGRLSTTGHPIAKPATRLPFHQQLLGQDCVSCHSDHSGVVRPRQHGQFNHALLEIGLRGQCQNCHTPPADTLHQQQAQGTCGQCHSQVKWRPSTFDHTPYFILDGDHNTRCETCHVHNDYQQYTCFGCHEHSLTSIRREHIEEGIRNFDNCVECHRSANEQDIRGKGKHGSGDDDDD